MNKDMLLVNKPYFPNLYYKITCIWTIGNKG